MGKAFLWAADEGGCWWYRMKIVADALRERGHEVETSQTYDDPDPEASYPVMGQRVCNPGPTQAWAKWCYQGRRTVFDADDNYYAIEPHAASSYDFFQRSSVRVRLMANPYASTYTTVCSEVLAQIWSQYCSNVVVIPNGLPERYLQRPRPDNRVPVVGWAGTTFTLKDLSLAADALKGVAYSGRAIVHTIGPHRPEMVQAGMVGKNIHNTSWVAPNEKYLDAIDFDIWVAPYRSTPYNEAKAPTKALEAAFLGIPIVASDISPYRHFVRDGVNGFLVRSHTEWERRIDQLLNEPELREQMSANARQIAVEHTIESLAPRWEQVLFEPRVRLA